LRDLCYVQVHKNETGLVESISVLLASPRLAVCLSDSLRRFRRSEYAKIVLSGSLYSISLFVVCLLLVVPSLPRPAVLGLLLLIPVVSAAGVARAIRIHWIYRREIRLLLIHGQRVGIFDW